jgi:uncharacterized protein (TIGR02271 family)
VSPANDPGVETHHENGIVHFFKSLFGQDEPDDAEASTYHEAFRRGSHALTVTTQTDAEVDLAEALLGKAGAIDIDESSQKWREEGWQGSSAGTIPMPASSAASGSTASTGSLGSTAPSAQSAPSASSTASTAAGSGDARTLQEVEEQLKVGKREVSRGGVRVYKRVTEVPVEETVALREERAHVTRRAVDRPVGADDASAFQEGSIELRETDEEAVVAKTARVVGEVDVSKEVLEREQTVRDTVRKSNVEVEQIEAAEPRNPRTQE